VENIGNTRPREASCTNCIHISDVPHPGLCAEDISLAIWCRTSTCWLQSPAFLAPRRVGSK
jgi:hypothetical protein